MSRKSKLTEQQWSEIARRFADGEASNALGAEFGVSGQRIRQKFGDAGKERIEAAAVQVAETYRVLAQLPARERVEALNIADGMVNVRAHLLQAAEYGARTANRMSYLAEKSARAINEDAVSLEDVSMVGGLMRTANISGEIGLKLITSKETTTNPVGTVPEPVTVTFNVVDGRL